MRDISSLYDQWMNSYHKMNFSFILRNLTVSYADIMRKKCGKEATFNDIHKEQSIIF